MRIAVYRRAHFNAAHKLSNPNWSEEKNREIFGKCSNTNFHGHNYEIEVKVVGEVDQETGMLINLSELKAIIEEEIEERFDHKNLDVDVPELKGKLTSVENLCYLCWQLLTDKLDDDLEVTVRLYETPRNYAEYPA